MFLNEGSAIYTRLAANSALITELGGTAIYERFVPASVSLPYVLFMENSGGNDNDAPRESRDLRITVKGVSSSYSQAKRIAAQIYSSLHEAEASMSAGSGWDIYRCQHTVDFEFTDKVETTQEYHVGGLYRMRIVAT